MRYLTQRLQSRIRNKIVLPYLLLALLVVLAGSTVAFLIVAGSLQERLEQRLRQSALITSQGVVDFEGIQLASLRVITANGPNVQERLLSTADAMASGSPTQLSAILHNAADFYQIDQLAAFDIQGHMLAQHQLNSQQPALGDLSQLAGILYVLNNQQDIIDGAIADKFSSVMVLQPPNIGSDPISYLYTTVPIRQRDPVTGEERLVGGLLAAQSLSRVVTFIRRHNEAFYTVFFDDNGRVLASNAPGEERELALDSATLQMLNQQPLSERALRTVPVMKRNFVFAYSPLRIRDQFAGYFGVGLEQASVFDSWMPTRNLILGLTLAVLLAVVAVGSWVSRWITRPIQRLAETATAISQGDLERRIVVDRVDEIGTLATIFNQMTGRLVELYEISHEEAQTNKAILRSIADGVVVCEPDGAIILANPAAIEMLALSTEELSRQRFVELPLVSLPRPPELRDPGQLYAINGHTILISVSPVRTEEGALLGTVRVLHDVTSQQELDRAKTNFIATVSHELRTPLTPIIGYLDLMLSPTIGGDLSEEQLLFLRTIRQHVDTINGILNNMVTLASIEAGSLKSTPRFIAAALLLREVLAPYKQPSEEKGLELQMELEDDLPLLYVDPEHVQTILAKLLDNAVRYTQQGSITLSASLQDEQVRIDVCDTGPGIAPEDQAHLFTRFSRGGEQQGLATRVRGSGLGLAIARHLAEQQGGSISLISELEAGSTFSLLLPSELSVEQSPSQQPDAAESASQQPAEVESNG